MYSLETLLDSYEEFHTNPTNRILHRIGIPLVVISIMIFFNWFTLSFAQEKSIPLSWVIAASVAGYYLNLNFKKTWLASLLIIIITWFITLFFGYKPTPFSFYSFLALFIVGWCLLLSGHFIEKNKPAFSENISHLLIGPLFLFQELFDYIKGLFQKSKVNSAGDD